MVSYYPDIFNDVFGPVMQPGSSSHTAGPVRIGYEAYCVLGEKPVDITVRLDSQGSFAGTFGLMYEDLGMLSGAFGLLPEDERIFDIRQILKERGISYRFEHVHLRASRHPNAVEFVLRGKSGKEISLTGNSTGGGRIEIININGAACHFAGDCWYYGVLFPAGEEKALERAYRESGPFSVCRYAQAEGGSAGLLFALSDRADASLSAYQAQVREKTGNVFCFCLRPVLPVCAGSVRKEQLFRDMTQWREYACRNEVSLPKAVILYEKASSGMSETKILEKMRYLRELMERQIFSIYEGEENLLENPFSGYHFREWENYCRGRKPFSGDCMALALRYAFGVQAQQRGVCLGPGPMGTGGGFLFSAISAVARTRGVGEDGVMDALLTAAGIGLISYSRGNPTGEVMGCMGECGVCAAMASAGIAQMCGGSPEQVENAASLALQMSFGWPCDPIPGGDNQPCMSRYLTAVVMSIVFADLALSGRDAVLPYHEVFDQAAALGKRMPEALKCTSGGGLCDCPGARLRKKAFDDWRGTA